MRLSITMWSTLWCGVAISAMSTDRPLAPRTRSAAQDTLIIAPARTLQFEVTEGTAMNLDISPDGRTIVFDLLGDIYTLPIEGGVATRLTKGMAFDGQPVFSPDGQRIAFVSDRSGTDNVWIMKSDGTELRNFSGDSTMAVGSPEWAPAGEFFLAARRTDGYWLYDSSGSGGSIAIGPAAQWGGGRTPQHGAVWSRDGRHLISASAGGGSSGSIIRTDVETGKSKTLSRGDWEMIRPAVSPDGESVAFIVRVDDRVGIRIVNVETEEERWVGYPLPGRSERNAGGAEPWPRYAFTPDGKAIVVWADGLLHRVDVETGKTTVIPFLAAVEQELGALGSLPIPPAPQDVTVSRIGAVRWLPSDGTLLFTTHGKIWVREPAGTIRALAEQPLVQLDPALSPDGRSVVYATSDEVAGGHLWRVGLTGGSPERLTRRAGSYRQPSWSPDGTMLTYVLEPDGGPPRWGRARPGAAYVMPAAGGTPRWIRAHEGSDAPRFSPDGRSLIVVARPDPRAQQPAPPARWGAPPPPPVITVPTLLAIDLATGEIDTVLKLPAPAQEIAISPDARLVAYTAHPNLYLAAIRSIGGAVPNVSTGPGWAQARQVDSDSAISLTWASDNRTLTWARGTRVMRIDGANAATGAKPTVDTTLVQLVIPRAKASGTVALVGAEVITMRGDEVIRDATIVVTDGRISAIGPRASITVPNGAQTFDLTGKFVIPGLIDARDNVAVDSARARYRNIPLAAALGFGVTTVGNPNGSGAVTLAEMQAAGAVLGARLLPTISTLDVRAANLTTADGAKKAVERLKAGGATTIEVTGVSSRRQRQWLVVAARDAGVSLVGGATDDPRVVLTMIADGYPAIGAAINVSTLHDDLLRLLAGSGTRYLPSLISGADRPDAESYFLLATDIRRDPKLRLFGLNEPGTFEWGTESAFRFISLSRQASELSASGVPVAVATRGKRPGIAVHWEMAALARGGMTPREALRAATVNAAEALGMAAELGSLEPGKAADLVVLDADPLAGIANSLAIRWVMRGGELFDANTLAMLWPRTTPAPMLRDTRYDPPGSSGSRSGGERR